MSFIRENTEETIERRKRIKSGRDNSRKDKKNLTMKCI
jgi:hypothetical protein